jgi:hypothetical protein
MHADVTQDLTNAAQLLDATPALAAADTRSIRDLIVKISGEHGYAIFGEAARLGQRLMERDASLERDPAFQVALARLSWVANDPATSIAASKRAVRLAPTSPVVYQLLGWVNLTSNQPVDAFLALSAGRFVAPEDGGLKVWHRLAELLARGIEQIAFDLDGVHYTFALSCFNGQAMETAVNHAHGSLPELGELRYLRQAVGVAPVIVEVGTLVGNHTVFFARNLNPRKIYCFDADPAAATYTTRNFKLNVRPGEAPELVMIDKAVGDAQRTIQLAGRTTEMTTLAAEVTEPVDFLKIDVDGMELAVLEGARPLLLASRPRLFIEVKHENEPAFRGVLGELGYTIAAEFKRAADCNFFAVPTGSSGATT